MRTRASTRNLEQSRKEDEKPQSQVAETEDPINVQFSPRRHAPKRRCLRSRRLDSSVVSQVKTRASLWNSESTKDEQQLPPEHAELQSSVGSEHQPESSESLSFDYSDSTKSRKRPLTDINYLEQLACEDKQHIAQTGDQQSLLPPTNSQYSVEPQSSIKATYSVPQTGPSEGKSTELKLSSCYGSNKKQRKTRGPTQCLGLLIRDDGLPLGIASNEFGQPIGPNARKLTSFLGTLVRDPKKAPLLWHDWRSMPQQYKDGMWGQVQEKFQVADSLKDWVLMSLATKWRNFKAYVKKKYYDGKSSQARLSISDKRVDPAHWQELVRFWDSDKGKRRCSTNRANRAKFHGVHTAGSKSFAMLREELRVKNANFQNPSQTEVYLLTHTRKDGQPIDNTSASVIAKLSAHASEQESLKCDTHKDAVLSEILGEDRHGRVRTFGLGPSPSDVYGPKPSRAQALQLVNDIKKTAEEKLTKMKEQMEAMKVEQEGMKAEQEEMKQKYEDRLSELQNQLQAVVFLVQGSNMNCQGLEHLAPQQPLISYSSNQQLQPPKANPTVSGNSLPNILRRRKVTGDTSSPQ